MQPTQPTVMLVRSEHLGWIGLRAFLNKQSGVTVVGDVQQADRALREVRTYHPNVLFVAADPPGLRLETLVRALQDASPRSKIIVVGTCRHQFRVIRLWIG